MVQKLEPMKLFCRDYPILPRTATFIYYVTPDVPVNMVAVCHCLDGERCMH